MMNLCEFSDDSSDPSGTHTEDCTLGKQEKLQTSDSVEYEF